jgi:hypothetical protein
MLGHRIASRWNYDIKAVQKTVIIGCSEMDHTVKSIRFERVHEP